MSLIASAADPEPGAPVVGCFAVTTSSASSTLVGISATVSTGVDTVGGNCSIS